MNTANYLILFLMFATLIALILGFVNMLRGGSAAKSNRLMVWRVVLQAAVVLLAGLFLAAH